MESLGGAPTPAVGWAAGIERLAMLVGAREEERLDVAVVAEDEQSFANAQRVATSLRQEGVNVELFVTGSPRKRRDKAIRLDPECIVTLRADMTERGFQLSTSGSGALYQKIEPLIANAISR